MLQCFKPFCPVRVVNELHAVCAKDYTAHPQKTLSQRSHLPWYERVMFTGISRFMVSMSSSVASLCITVAPLARPPILAWVHHFTAMGCQPRSPLPWHIAIKAA